MKNAIQLILLISIGIHLTFALENTRGVDALSSATCPAVKENIPENLSIRITGKVKKEYLLSSEYLSNLSTVRIRTREVTPDGNMMGAYIYHGIPLYFILDGIAPLKDKTDLFDRPLDMIVTFISESRMTSSFSYGELTMCDDNNPVTLAYHRAQLLPSKAPDNYKKNVYKDPLQGLRLICPGDLYEDRYLDDVIAIKLTVAASSDKLFPEMSKGKECQSKKFFYIKDSKKYESSLDEIPLITYPNWIRIGHGRGIKSKRPETVRGYGLRSWLDKHFGPGNPSDFYIFAGCDGYRSIFSWSEIYRTGNGEKMMLIPEEKGLTLGPVGDFFIDRDVRALSCVEKITL